MNYNITFKNFKMYIGEETVSEQPSSKAAVELAKSYLKAVKGKDLTHCQKLNILRRLIDDAAGPLVEILNEAHEALGDYRYHGFNIRIEVLLAEWAKKEQDDGK